MKWVWLFLVDPAKALDWHDAKHPDHLDHGKVGSDLVILTFVVLDCIVTLRRSTYPPVGHLITLISGAMGARVFLAFLRSRTVTSHEEVLIEPPIQRDIDDPDAPGGEGAAL